MTSEPGTLTRRDFTAVGLAAAVAPGWGLSSPSGVLSTGPGPLDHALGGWLPAAGLVAVTACPGGGQTALATAIALGAARTAGCEVVYRTLHEESGRVLDALVARGLGVPQHRVRNHLLTAAEFDSARDVLLALRRELSFEHYAWLTEGPALPALPGGSVHVFDRLDDLWSGWDGACPWDRLAWLRGLRRLAHDGDSLVIVVANAEWPPDEAPSTAPAEVTSWGAAAAVADVHLRFGPPASGGAGAMTFEVATRGGGRGGELWVDAITKRVGSLQARPA